jgi:hypothetical protein
MACGAAAAALRSCHRHVVWRFVMHDGAAKSEPEAIVSTWPVTLTFNLIN